MSEDNGGTLVVAWVLGDFHRGKEICTGAFSLMYIRFQ